MAKKKLKKKSPNQIEYRKQINRIKQAIRRAEKRGYIFKEDVLPSQPKRVTKQAIQRLKEITPNVLYSKAEYVDKSTGEIVSGTHGRKLERKASAKKASVTRKINKEAERQFWAGDSTNDTPTYYPNGGDIIYQNVLDDFISKISEPTHEYTPWGKPRQQATYEASERGRTTLYSLTMRVKNEIGESALGWRIQEHSDEIQDLLTYVLYGSNAEHIASATSQLANIITDGTLTMSDLVDIAYEEEQNESWESPL